MVGLLLSFPILTSLIIRHSPWIYHSQPNMNPHGVWKTFLRPTICTICVEDRNDVFVCTSDFQRICHGCMRAYVDSCISNNTFNIKCIHCPEQLCYHHVKNSASPDAFERYEREGVIAIMAQEEDWRFCMRAECHSGQVHPDPESNPIFTCVGCGFKHCVLCQVPWHEGRTCTQARNNSNDQEGIEPRRGNRETNQSQLSTAPHSTTSHTRHDSGIGSHQSCRLIRKQPPAPLSIEDEDDDFDDSNDSDDSSDSSDSSDYLYETSKGRAFKKCKKLVKGFAGKIRRGNAYLLENRLERERQRKERKELERLQLEFQVEGLWQNRPRHTRQQRPEEAWPQQAWPASPRFPEVQVGTNTQTVYRAQQTAQEQQAQQPAPQRQRLKPSPDLEATTKRRQAAENAQSQAMVESLTKRCPRTSCKAPIQKASGCDHMTCRFSLCLCLRKKRSKLNECLQVRGANMSSVGCVRLNMMAFGDVGMRRIGLRVSIIGMGEWCFGVGIWFRCVGVSVLYRRQRLS